MARQIFRARPIYGILPVPFFTMMPTLSMELSSEDALRLNVLLANDLQAIRVDDSRMVVYGLSERGEAKVTLNPTCRDDRYLRIVGELISGHIMGSPGRYPVFLRRWARMGQQSNVELDKLLLLGEPEAVVAVACAPNLTPELARRAWWAMPEAENARRMLQNPAVVGSDMGPILAEHLVDYLPFEEDPAAMMESVRLALQPGLIDDTTRDKLWNGGKRKTAYLVGFLQTLPDHLPEPQSALDTHESLNSRLQPLAKAGNPYARLLLRISSTAGQTWLHVVDRVLAKPPNQEVVGVLLATIADYFATVRPELPEAEINALINDAERLCPTMDDTTGLYRPDQLQAVLDRAPAARDALRAMLCLSRLGFAVVRPVFSRSDAIGSLMRRKLEPIIGPMREQLAALQQPGGRTPGPADNP